MSYIDSNLLPDEQILFRTKKHLIIFIYPLLVTAVAVYTNTYMLANPFLFKLAFAPWLVALIFWSYVGLEYQYSDFAVTNKRIMMREGFFVRHTNEMRLATVSQVNIGQSLLGQFLNYGTVVINAFGSFDAFTVIANPGAFQKAVNTQLDKIAK